MRTVNPARLDAPSLAALSTIPPRCSFPAAMSANISSLISALDGFGYSIRPTARRQILPQASLARSI
jgi:hypothetical protein